MLKDKKEPQVIEDTVECVEALAKILKENDLGRIKISTEEIEIEIDAKRCPPPHHPHGAPHMPMPPMGVPGQLPMGAMPPMSAPAPADKPAETPEKGNFITSPIIGTFYTSPAPEKPCFVKVGDTVNVGDVVCIIESMKLMNEITSEFSGRVAEVYVDNGESVEFGQKLMRIE